MPKEIGDEIEKEKDETEVLDEAKEAVEDLNREIVEMEEMARQMQELRKMLIAQAAEKIEDMDIEGFSNNAGALYLGMSKLYIDLCLVKMNKPDNEIIDQAEEIRKEVDLLGERLKIAANVREIIYNEGEETVRACQEFLNPKK